MKYEDDCRKCKYYYPEEPIIFDLQKYKECPFRGTFNCNINKLRYHLKVLSNEIKKEGQRIIRKITNIFSFKHEKRAKDKLHVENPKNVVSKTKNLGGIIMSEDKLFVDLGTDNLLNEELGGDMKRKLCIYAEIIDECANTYLKKNSDYGDSFSKIYKRFGLQSSVIRLFDKLNRLESLMVNERQVDDETIEDTLKDIINYSIMTLIEQQLKDDDANGNN